MNTSLRSILFGLLVAIVSFCSNAQRVVAAETNAPVRKAMIAARQITLPEFKCEGVTLSDGVKKLSEASRRYDAKHKGINYIVPDKVTAEANPKVTLDLRNVTVAEATERLAKSAGVRVQAEDYAFIFRAKGE